MPHVPPELQAAAEPIGLDIESVLHHTGKTLLAAGQLAGVRVAVKYLNDRDPFWAGKWRHELAVYQAFAETPPPLRVPRLLYSDRQRLMVIEWLDGRRLHDQRYPPNELPAEQTHAALRCVTALNQWPGPYPRFEKIFDYPDRFDRYHAGGYLSDGDRDALSRLLTRCGEPDQLNHGDPVPANILLLPDGGATLLDWEFTGCFLPGFDLAMLHTLLGAATPAAADRIDQIVAETRIGDAFAINLAAVLTRELRIHRELPDTSLRHTRLPLIDAAWAHARRRLHRLASGGS